MDIIDGLLLVCGVFCIYQAVWMKRGGRIPEGVFLSQGISITSAADVDGYIRSIFGKAIFLGLLGVVCGCCGLLEGKYPEYRLGFALLDIGYVVCLVAFMVWMRKAQDKYLR